MVQTILSIQPHEAAGSETTSSDDVVSGLSNSIASRILKTLDRDDIHPHLMKALNTFLSYFAVSTGRLTIHTTYTSFLFLFPTYFLNSGMKKEGYHL